MGLKSFVLDRVPTDIRNPGNHGKLQMATEFEKVTTKCEFCNQSLNFGAVFS